MNGLLLCSGKFYGRSKTKQKVEGQKVFSGEVMSELWFEECVEINEDEKENKKSIKQRLEEKFLGKKNTLIKRLQK